MPDLTVSGIVPDLSADVMGFLLLPSLQGFEAAKTKLGAVIPGLRNDHRLTLNELRNQFFQVFDTMSGR